MARLQTHEVAFAFESEITERLRALKVPRATAIAQSIVPRLIAQVPTEAFEMKPAWEIGQLFFNGDVTEESASNMQMELADVHLNIKKDIPITLYLSSFGGSVESGMALFSMIQELRRAGRIVNAHISGTAMSMATILVQACDVRTIEPYATMMLHESSDYFEGKVSDAKDRIEFNERYDRILNGIYAARSGKPIEYWSERQKRRDWYLTAREAVTEGLVDRIRPIKPYPKKTEKKKEEASNA